MKTQKGRNTAQQTCNSEGSAHSMNTGLKGNEYAVNNWDDYYHISLKRAEQGMDKAKDRWFSTQHSQWAAKNKGILENTHFAFE